MPKFLLRWFVASVALYVAVRLVPGITYEGGWQTLAGMALIFGLVNAIVRPILALIILTMGVFLMVLNGAMLLLASRLASILGVDFYVMGFGSAFLGALVVSVVSFLMNLFIGNEEEDKQQH